MSGILGSVKTTMAGEYLLYTVPAGKVFEGSVFVCSLSPASTKVVLYITPTTTVVEAGVVQLNTLTPLERFYERKNITLSEGESVQISTDGGDIHATLTGILRDSSGLSFRANALITSNTETAVYTVGSGKTNSVSVTVSLVGAAPLEKSDITIYTSPSNAANGKALKKLKLESDAVTGLQFGGIFLTSGDKIVVVTENIVGKVAVRVDGFERSYI